VSQPVSPALPSWITKRDGRLVPFEPDKISQALFAVSEELQQPNAFLAREMADGVLHFLTAELEGAIPTTGQIAEFVTKVVRELGHPSLAHAFADYARRRAERPAQFRRADAPRNVALHFNTADDLSTVLHDCARAYGLQAVFTRDLLAAHDDGLITLHNLAAPFELAGQAPELSLERVGSLLERLLDLRQIVAGVVALDGPEFLLGLDDGSAEHFVRELTLGLRATGLRAVVNLNVSSPPAWANDLAAGPLFSQRQRVPDASRRALLADALQIALAQADGIRVDWHLSEQDFDNGSVERLQRVASRALDIPLTFVFDRPRQVIALAEGIDRQHPVLLVQVSLNLSRLAEHPGLAGQFDLFLRKLGSLARLALSAGVQKRDFLRRRAGARPAVARGFVLDRARLLVIPVGLEAVVRGFTAQGLCEERSLSLARRIVQRLDEVLRSDGRTCLLDVCLGGPAEMMPETCEVSGLTTWDATTMVKDQLKSSGALHSEAGGGTAAVLLPEADCPTPGQIADWLRWAWNQTALLRVRFVRERRKGVYP
jgi:hypothetical protein